MDGRPPSRQIEEAILAHPIVEGPEERLGPCCFDSSGQHTDLFIRPLSRSVSELTLCGNAVGVRPRANSLQDGRRLTSPSGSGILEDFVTMKSLPTPGMAPPLFGGPAPGKSLNVEAPPFIPPPGLKTPPTEPSGDAATSSPPAPDPSPIAEPVDETCPPSPHVEGGDFNSSTSTVKPMASVATTMDSEPPSKQVFTSAERRAVETVINVLLEMKSKGQARASPGNLPPLILAKDRTVYRNVGGRANRFWKLIHLGVQMGWLETGPGNVWIDVGKGWTEDIES